MLSSLTRLATGATLALALSACTTTATIVSVTIAGGDRVLSHGTSITLSVHVQATGGASTAVTWTSSDPDVATIDASGTVDALTPGTSRITATSTTDTSKSDSITLTVNPPGTLAWTRQFGTSSNDYAYGVATDTTGNVFSVGQTAGAIEGLNAGESDAFIRSYDASGNLRWTRQFGTSGIDIARGVATDSNGNVYVAGNTSGNLEGATAGNSDAFIRSYDHNGNVRWTRQFGTSSGDAAFGIIADASGNVYTAGHTTGALEGANVGSVDAFVRSYDGTGALRWTRQFGTNGEDYAYGIATDAEGNVYTAGYTDGALDGANAGSWDAFIRSYDTNGTLRWTRQFGTAGGDSGFDVATDTAGNVYALGYTDGALDGANAGSWDAFIRSYDTDGTLRWTLQFGTSDTDYAMGVSTDGNDNVYATGYTLGVLEGAHAGGTDAFIRKYEP
jgi:hypothetical protein